MGRKIPAKKHRGVKDPLEQHARRMQSLQGKINAPPTDPDDQPVPRSLTELFAFKDEKKNIKKKKLKKASNIRKEQPTGRNPVEKLRQLPGESQRSFSLRINSAMRALSQPENYDFMEDTEHEDVKGTAMAAWQQRRDRRSKQKLKQQGTSEVKDNSPKLTRGQKLTLKKNARKLKAAESAVSEAVQYERVEFGDVVSAPPVLSAPRRAQPSQKARRGLLLHALMGGATEAPRSRVSTPPAEALRLERARLDAVAAYRALKAQRAATAKTGR